MSSIEDPGSLLRSRADRRLLVSAGLRGIAVSVASRAFLIVTCLIGRGEPV